MSTFAELLGVSASPAGADLHLSTAPRTRRAAKSTSSAGAAPTRAGASKVDRSASHRPAPARDFSHLPRGAEARQEAGGIVQREASPDADLRARRAVALLEGRDPAEEKRRPPAASHPLSLPPEAQLAATGLSASRIMASYNLAGGGRR